MEPVILIFVMATGFVALTAVIPLLFWFIQTESSNRQPQRPGQTYRSADFQVKSVPPATRQYAYATQGTAENSWRPAYEVKAIPGVTQRRPPARRIWVAS